MQSDLRTGPSQGMESQEPPWDSVTSVFWTTRVSSAASRYHPSAPANPAQPPPPGSPPGTLCSHVTHFLCVGTAFTLGTLSGVNPRLVCLPTRLNPTGWGLAESPLSPVGNREDPAWRVLR